MSKVCSVGEDIAKADQAAEENYRVANKIKSSSSELGRGNRQVTREVGISQRRCKAKRRRRCFTNDEVNSPLVQSGYVSASGVRVRGGLRIRTAVYSLVITY